MHYQFIMTSKKITQILSIINLTLTIIFQISQPHVSLIASIIGPYLKIKKVLRNFKLLMMSMAFDRCLWETIAFDYWNQIFSGHSCSKIKSRLSNWKVFDVRAGSWTSTVPEIWELKHGEGEMEKILQHYSFHIGAQMLAEHLKGKLHILLYILLYVRLLAS